MMTTLSPLWAVLIREVSLFQKLIYTQKSILLGPQKLERGALISVVSLKRCPLRERTYFVASMPTLLLLLAIFWRQDLVLRSKVGWLGGLPSVSLSRIE